MVAIYMLFFWVVLIVVIVLLYRRSKSLGKIKVTLEKTGVYSMGEVVKGKIFVDFKKNIKAKELNLRFFALADRVAGKAGMGPGEIPIFYDYTMSISGQGDYFKSEFPFVIQIPLEISNPNNEKIVWFLEAKLSVSGLPELGGVVEIEVK